MVRETCVSQTVTDTQIPEHLVKMQNLSSRSGWGLRFSISNKSPGDTDAADPRTTLNITALDLADSREEMVGGHLRLDRLSIFAVLHQDPFYQ